MVSRPPVQLGVVLALLLVGHPAAPQTSSFQFKQVDLRVLEEVRLNDERYEREGLVYKDAAVEALIDRLTRRLLAEDPAPDRVAWRFRILRSPVFNAFALPNGSIYIHTGLIAGVDSEAQLTGLLAHELTHVTGRHGFAKVRNARKKTAAINIINAAVGYASIATPYTSGWRVVLDVMSNVPVLLEASIYGYSRETERDADLRAVEILDRAGYGAPALVGLLQHIARWRDLEGEIEPVFWSSHPRTEERLAYTRTLAAPAAPAGDNSLPDSRYLGVVAGLIRHNAQLAIAAGRPRSAVADVQRLVNLLPESSENLFSLAEAYGALGGRTPQPLERELSTRARVTTMKKQLERTPEEYEQTLMATREGQAAFRANREAAERLYRRALEVDPANHKVHRGLGFLYERAGERDAALRAFRDYLQAAPDADDRGRIARRVALLERRGTQ